jgi:hypothetical protein
MLLPVVPGCHESLHRVGVADLVMVVVFAANHLQHGESLGGVRGDMQVCVLGVAYALLACQLLL